MDPIMIQLGPLALRWYGFLIALGVLIGSSWALFEAKKRNLDTGKLQDMTLWLVLAGLIGARLVYVLTSPAAYFGPDGNPLSAVAIWQGGGSIHGGILGIFVAGLRQVVLSEPPTSYGSPLWSSLQQVLGNRK